MSDTQQTCEACGVSLMAPPDGITTFPADTLCGKCARAGIVWAAKQAHGVCPKCGKVHPPAMPAGFQMPARCGRPDCPVCNPKPAASRKGERADE